MLNEMILSGFYKHYKGGVYYVHGVAQHTETGELLVIYSGPHMGESFHARPASMWFNQVGVDKAGQPITRFTRCECRTTNL